MGEKFEGSHCRDRRTCDSFEEKGKLFLRQGKFVYFVSVQHGMYW
jgi:hypothetical protein